MAVIHSHSTKGMAVTYSHISSQTIIIYSHISSQTMSLEAKSFLFICAIKLQKNIKNTISKRKRKCLKWDWSGQNWHQLLFCFCVFWPMKKKSEYDWFWNVDTLTQAMHGIKSLCGYSTSCFALLALSIPVATALLVLHRWHGLCLWLQHFLFCTGGISLMKQQQGWE